MNDIFPPNDANQQHLSAEETESAASPWPEAESAEEKELTGASADPVEEPEAPADIHSLSPVEVRVLACLIEKEKTVPQSYPLTLHSLTLACNQTSSREPVMQLEEGEASSAAKSLQQKALLQSPPSARVERYSHCAHRTYDLPPAALAVICTLMLRGPQTASEIFQRSRRIHPFVDREEVESALDALMQRQPALACPHRSPGRGLRYMHCLASASSPPPAAAAPEVVPAPAGAPVEQPGAAPSASADSQAAPAATPVGQLGTELPASVDSQLAEALERLSQQVGRLIDRLDRLEQYFEGHDRGQHPFD